MSVMESRNKENSPFAETQSELGEARWSVVSFEKCAASSLTYEQARQKLSEMAGEKVSGLCIITDEAASRVKNSI